MSLLTPLYLDHAATSWPKPESVYQASEAYSRTIGGSYGRGGYRRAQETARLVDQSRNSLARLLGVTNPRQLAFTYSCTDSLNFVFQGLLRPGDHVIATVFEHNSVLRPLSQLHELGAISFTLVEPDENGRITSAAIDAAITEETRLACVTHSSNVTGILQDVQAIGELCQERDIFFLIDAAQTAGHVPLSLSSMAVDFVAMSGHKGLLGPLGTGLLYVREEMEQHVLPYRLGGTGTNSEELLAPEEMPARFESGSLNVPGIVGLGAAAEFLLKEGVEALQSNTAKLTQLAIDRLLEIEGLSLAYPDVPASDRVGVLSLIVDGFEPEILASILDDSFGIQVRAGLHCAPKAHEFIGTLASGGMLRASIGHATTEGDVVRFVEAMKSIVTSTSRS